MSFTRNYHRPNFKPKSAKPYQCCTPVAGVYACPDRNSAIDDQLLYGQIFLVSSSSDDGRAYGQVQPLYGEQAGYVGYVDWRHLKEPKGGSFATISAIKAPVFSRADIKSPILSFLSHGSRVGDGGISGAFLNIGNGYIHTHHLGYEFGRVDDFVETAKGYLGLPYIWGGKSGDGVDCSGLVQMALWASGRDCPRDADQQEAALGHDVEVRPDLSGLRRGDLVFWKGHVGIMEDAHTLLHANGHFMMTMREPLNDAARRIQKSAGPITSIKRL